MLTLSAKRKRRFIAATLTPAGSPCHYTYLVYLIFFFSNHLYNRTWGYTLKAKGWRRLGSMAEVDDAQVRMRNSLKLGLYINVAGMLLALIGAEQIVGTLVAKVLYSQGEGLTPSWDFLERNDLEKYHK